MSQHDTSPESSSADGRRTFSWSFSLGSKADSLRQSMEAARAAGVEPEVRQHVWEFDPLAILERMEQTESQDSLRWLRRFLAWLPRAVFLTMLAGGVVLGFFEPTLGPIWGGIFGAVLGGFFCKMTQPNDWWNRF